MPHITIISSACVEFSLIPPLCLLMFCLVVEKMNTRQPNTSFFVLLTIILRLSSKYDHKIATFVLYLVDVQAEGRVSDKHEIRLLEMEKRHSKIKKSYWAYLDHLCRKGTNSRGRGSTVTQTIWAWFSPNKTNKK